MTVYMSNYKLFAFAVSGETKEWPNNSPERL